jgi:hypothetical protein
MQNLDKTLRLLNLPSEMGAINGQVNKRSVKSLVENRINDFTKMVKNPTTGKMEPTRTSTFTVETSVSLFGVYPLNLAAGHIHWGQYDIVDMSNGSFKLYKPFTEIDHLYTNDASGNIVLRETPLKGWIGWSEIHIVPTANGYDYKFYWEQGDNVTRTGEPVPHDPNTVTRSILRREYVKTSTFDGVKLNKFSRTFPRYTITQLLNLAGMTETQLAECYSHTWHVERKSDETHCLNIASDIVIVDDNTIKGEAYINGILSSQIPFTSLISSYGKNLPDFVCRYKLYNEKFKTPGDNVYGTAWNRMFASNQDTTLKLKAGTEVKYDSATNTLTYPPDSKLVFDFEFLPAQGKNETVGACLDLDTMEKSLW